MPKVNIYPLPNPDGTDADRRVEVGWSRDGLSVQVGTTRLAPGASRDSEFVAAEPDPGAAMIRLTNLSPTATTSTTSIPVIRPAWDGQFVELTRDQINHLIRVLREARNAACGADE